MVEVRKMRIFEVLDGNKEVTYVCCSKSTRIPCGYRLIEDVTKKEKIDYDLLTQELEKTEISETAKLLIVALVADHQQKIFGEV